MPVSIVECRLPIETDFYGRLEVGTRHSAIGMNSSLLLADCHLHFEGCLPAAEITRLALRAGHPFADPAVFETARRAVRDTDSFLLLYAEICRLFRRPEDYVQAALAVGESLSDDGIAYAEIYVSPEIFARLGLDPAACLTAIDAGLRESLETRGILCRILLDAVRHWGPESAERVLDVYESTPLQSIVGFGLGGDEKSLPASAFGGTGLLRLEIPRPMIV